MATKDLVASKSLGAIIVYTETGQFEQAIHATFATVHYLHAVSLFHMQQAHKCLLAIVVITCVPLGWYVSNSVGLQKSFTENLIAGRRDLYRLGKYFYIP